VYQEVHHRKAARGYLRCCTWWYEIGVKAHTLRWGHEAAISMNSGFSGQVEQQAHPRPGVLETDAVRLAVLMRAFEAA
jgi:hypothetical protein